MCGASGEKERGAFLFRDEKRALVTQINQNLPRQSVGATCGRPKTNGLRLLGRANCVRPYEILRCLKLTDQSKFTLLR